jgi:putative transposase
VEADPTLAVAEIVNRFKSRSSRLMRQEFPALRSRLPTLWSRSYYPGSVGHVSAKVVEAYIAAQKGTGAVAVRSYKYRLRPNRAQTAALDAMLRDFCGLYNACLQQRVEAYRRRGLNLRYGPQASELKACRACDPDGLGRWSFSALQQVLRRLDQTYAAFFKRGHGFPRFRASARYHAATFRIGDGLTVKKDRRIGVVGVVGVPGGLKVAWHRDLPDEAKLGTAILTRQQGKWFMVLSVEAEFAETCGTGTVGIDLGLNSLIATSDGETVEMPRFARKAQKAQRWRQRALARCKRGSKRRLKAKARLAAGSAKIARQRRDHLHKLSRSLVSRYWGIAFEDLTMTGLNLSRVWDSQSQDTRDPNPRLQMWRGSGPGCCCGDRRASAGFRAGTRPSGHKPAGCRIAVPRSRLLQRAELSRLGS